MVDITADDYSVRLCDSRFARKSLFNDNEIHTTKYSLVSFLPFCILYQFKRLANLYFLITAIVQCVPQISPLDPFTAIGPLMLVLFIALVKEAYEDYKRYRNDKGVNAGQTRVMRDGKWTSVQWRHVRLGDLVQVSDGETFPADLILLRTSESDGSAKIQTANLDGERNLKTKQSIPLTWELFDGEELKENAGLMCKVGAPDDKLEGLEGCLVSDTGEVKPLAGKQLLLRVRCMQGSNLRNTAHIYGMVIYTGAHTKIMMNQG